MLAEDREEAAHIQRGMPRRLNARVAARVSVRGLQKGHNC